MNDNSFTILENNCVAERTKKRYASSNIELALWMNQNHSEVVREGLKRKLEEIEESEVRPKKKKKERDAVIRDQWLLKMEKAKPELCPIDMTMVTYEMIAEFMATKKQKQASILVSPHMMEFVQRLCFFLL